VISGKKLATQKPSAAKQGQGIRLLESISLSAATWLQAWDAHGFHRTGTSGDEAGAAWVAREATTLGAQVTSETFDFERVDPQQTFLELDGTCIEAVPVFDAPPTDATGISGTIGPVGGDTAIGVVALSPQLGVSGEYERLRRGANHHAIVIVARGALAGLALVNADQFNAPYGAPALQVSSEAHDAVFAASSARLVADYHRTPASARNVVVTIAGRDSTRPPVVVMTPRSSWWQSTAERGGGLVCWLESLRALLEHPPSCDVVLTANCGHELGFLGLDNFLARRRGWERTATWVHWGANLGATGGQLAVASAQDELRSLADNELGHAGQAADVLAPRTQVPAGETRDIHRAGGRYITLVGSNPWFHLPQDRWPDTVNVAVVARIASAAARIVLALTR
jgi:hypothetical protein